MNMNVIKYAAGHLNIKCHPKGYQVVSDGNKQKMSGNSGVGEMWKVIAVEANEASLGE